MNNLNKIKGIIFDLGGVLVEAFGKEFVNYASKNLGVSADKLGKAVQSKEPPLQRGEINAIQFWKNVCEELKIKYPNEETMRKLWVEPYKKHANIKEDTLAYIKKLKGKYKLAILSNTIKEHNEINKKRNLYNDFDVVLLSNEIGMRKPEKKFFIAASKKLGLPFKELVFVDDELRWIKAAQNYGLKAVLFDSVEQLKSSFKKLGINVK